MEIIHSIAEMTATSRQMRQAGSTIALVPTMGFFHEGHLQLMRFGRQRADRLVVSLFVNPIQFGPNEDLQRYPRDFGRDATLAEQERVDVLFAPDSREMYGPEFQTRITVEHLTAPLCGGQRPGHFDGVTTVVAKLFNIVHPHSAIFGEKDFQQLVVIRRMVDDLNFDITILGHVIVREHDGLAMSSRNSYLSPDERQSALCLYESLQLARHMVSAGEVDVDRLLKEILARMQSYPGVTVDYVAVVDQATLQEKKKVDRSAILAMAVRVGATRLIDNGRLC
jgi:pantoate--beta-alanine ligase